MSESSEHYGHKVSEGLNALEEYRLRQRLEGEVAQLRSRLATAEAVVKLAERQHQLDHSKFCDICAALAAWRQGGGGTT